MRVDISLKRMDGGQNKKVEVSAFEDCVTFYTYGGGRVAKYVENMYHNKDSKYT